MKALARIFGIGTFWLQSSLAQPTTNSSNVFLDIDQQGANDVVYSIGASKTREWDPERWSIGSGADVQSNARFLKSASGTVVFMNGEGAGVTSQLFEEELPGGGGIMLGFGIIGYWAENYSPSDPTSWIYTPIEPKIFNSLREFIAGIRIIVDGAFHYGWVRFSRPAVDEHTLFEIVGHDWNPIPEAAIGAGEPPPPPPLQGTVDESGQLTFQWDSRAGEMIFEYTDSLGPSSQWQLVPDSYWPPVSLAFEDETRFFRLRRP